MRRGSDLAWYAHSNLAVMTGELHEPGCLHLSALFLRGSHCKKWQSPQASTYETPSCPSSRNVLVTTAASCGLGVVLSSARQGAGRRGRSRCPGAGSGRPQNPIAGVVQCHAMPRHVTARQKRGFGWNVSLGACTPSTSTAPLSMTLNVLLR